MDPDKNMEHKTEITFHILWIMSKRELVERWFGVLLQHWLCEICVEHLFMIYLFIKEIKKIVIYCGGLYNCGRPLLK